MCTQRQLLFKRAADVLRMNQMITARDNSFGHRFLKAFTIVQDHELYSMPEKQLLLSKLVSIKKCMPIAGWEMSMEHFMEVLYLP